MVDDPIEHIMELEVKVAQLENEIKSLKRIGDDLASALRFANDPYFSYLRETKEIGADALKDWNEQIGNE